MYVDVLGLAGKATRLTRTTASSVTTSLCGTFSMSPSVAWEELIGVMSKPTVSGIPRGLTIDLLPEADTILVHLLPGDTAEEHLGLGRHHEAGGFEEAVPGTEVSNAKVGLT